jgi:hypothetical protein
MASPRAAKQDRPNILKRREDRVEARLELG